MPLISAREVTKRYPGVLALDALSVDLEPGVIGLVGANGAGKSTFLRVLLGLLAPTSGSVSILGLDVRTHTLEVRKHVGYLPEHDCLPIEVTATDFVTHMGRMAGLPPTQARERAAESLRHVGLHEERYRLMGTFSTGMKQRAKLAQALVHDPELLLLDEPTNGLDPTGRDEMLGLVERIGREFGISVIVTSHLLGEIERVCDYLLVMEEGKLRYAGTVAKFTERTRHLLVDLEDESGAFVARVRAAGLDVATEGHSLRVALTDDGTYDVIRDVAAELGLPLTRLELQRHNLGDLFRPTGNGEATHG
ncbi:MAG TPA: ABC transporter ATP-binding protein [Gemmatimonadaceae bacterium]|nr:ABC transporter ATP-binding protein [Gemmatimonadaceae bacterium]